MKLFILITLLCISAELLSQDADNAWMTKDPRVQHTLHLIEQDSMEQAIHYILPLSFRQFKFSHKRFARFTADILSSVYQEEYLITELEKAFENYERRHAYSSEYNNYFIQYLGQEIQINMMFPNGATLSQEIERSQSVLMQEHLYKFLKEDLASREIRN